MESNKINLFELLVSENCNLRCKYCFDDNLVKRNNCEAKMKPDMIPSLLSFIQDNRDISSPTRINFFGGEPLLNFDFIKEFVTAMSAFDFEKQYTLTTNGTLMTPEIVRYMVDNNFGVTVSIDGVKKSHNISRSNWDETMNNLPLLISTSAIPIGINMVIDPQNIEYLIDSYSFFADLGDLHKNVSITLLFNYDKDWSDDDLSKLKDALILSIVRNKITPSNFEKIRSCKCECITGYCLSPSYNVTINSSGKLFFCHRETPKLSIPDGFNDYYGDIYTGYTNKEFINKMDRRFGITNLEECQLCSIKQWCQGGCILAHQQYTHDYFKLNPNVCKISKVIDEVYKTVMESK